MDYDLLASGLGFPEGPVAMAGGSVILNVTAPYAGTVTTTGAGSIGLYATGSGSTEEGTVASSIAGMGVPSAASANASAR